MAKRPKLTDSEFEIIRAHIEPLIESSRQAAIRFRERLAVEFDEYIDSQVSYHRNAASALKWALAIAKQRTEGIENEHRSGLLRPRSDTF